MNAMKTGAGFWMVLMLSLLVACASEPRPMAMFADKPDSKKPGLVIKIGPEKNGLSEVQITGSQLESAVVLGEARREGEGWRITLLKMEWFNNWENGWTQASFLLDGTASVSSASTGWTLAVGKAPLLDSVESASIRYFDTFLRDDKGLAEFTHRWERIQAVATDLSLRLGASASTLDPRNLKRRLFPEIFGYETPPAPGHARVLAQGHTWDSDYSKEHFSDPLRILRDSGSLLRDFKESSGLWFLALKWKEVWGGEITLQREL